MESYGSRKLHHINMEPQGLELGANSTFSAVITLSVSPTIAETSIVEFSFDIIIIGTEYT